MLTNCECAAVRPLRNSVVLAGASPEAGKRSASIGNAMRERFRKSAKMLLAWVRATYGPDAIESQRLRAWWGI